MNFLSGWSIFRCYVSFRECRSVALLAAISVHNVTVWHGNSSIQLHPFSTCIAEYQDVQWYFWKSKQVHLQYLLSIVFICFSLRPCFLKYWHNVDPTRQLCCFCCKGRSTTCVPPIMPTFFLLIISRCRHFLVIYQTKSTWEPKRMRFDSSDTSSVKTSQLLLNQNHAWFPNYIIWCVFVERAWISIYI